MVHLKTNIFDIFSDLFGLLGTNDEANFAITHLLVDCIFHQHIFQ